MAGAAGRDREIWYGLTVVSSTDRGAAFTAPTPVGHVAMTNPPHADGFQPIWTDT